MHNIDVQPAIHCFHWLKGIYAYVTATLSCRSLATEHRDLGRGLQHLSTVFLLFSRRKRRGIGCLLRLIGPTHRRSAASSFPSTFPYIISLTRSSLVFVQYVRNIPIFKLNKWKRSWLDTQLCDFKNVCSVCGPRNM